MRTAEQILKDNDLALDKWPDTKIIIKQAINDARKEALKEAASKCIEDGNPLTAKYHILNLINELK